MLDSSSGRWFALTAAGGGFDKRAHAHREFRALEQLRRDGIPSFVPIERIMRRVSRHARRRELWVLPMWAGYVFARMAVPPSREDFARWPNVWGVVKRGLTPAELPADLIDSVRRLAGGEVLLGELPHDMAGRLRDGAKEYGRQPFKIGDRVVTPAGVAGAIEAVDRQKATILIEMLGSLRRVSTAVRDLEHQAPARLSWA